MSSGRLVHYLEMSLKWSRNLSVNVGSGAVRRVTGVIG